MSELRKFIDRNQNVWKCGVLGERWSSMPRSDEGENEVLMML